MGVSDRSCIPTVGGGAGCGIFYLYEYCNKLCLVC